jgi:hypothetical protein
LERKNDLKWKPTLGNAEMLNLAFFLIGIARAFKREQTVQKSVWAFLIF